MPKILRSEALDSNVHYFVKWTLFSLLCGLVIGSVGALLRRAVDLVTANWNAHPAVILLAPVSILLTNLLVKLLHEEKNGGTNTVIDSISEGKHISRNTAPLLFFSTILSHTVGASVGKEGAALMIGGSLGEFFADLIRFDEREKRIAILCGMSACFSALFGTPLSAALFSIEMISIGSLYYSALVPCIFASFFASELSRAIGNHADVMPVPLAPPFRFGTACTTVLFGIYMAGVAVLFAVILYNGSRRTARLLPNPWIRGITASVLLILLTALNYRFLAHGFQFNGGGFPLAKLAMEEQAPWYSFALKLLFTCVCVFGGYKGGEIVPTFCLGACAGAFFAQVLGLDVRLFTACGMTAMFCGMTNCPITSLLLSFELFGEAGMPYYAVAIAVSFTFSGYYGLYTSQRFSYSKTQNAYIGRKGPRGFWKDRR